MMLYDLKYVGTSSAIVKFADDIVMVASGNSWEQLEESVIRDVELINKYYKDNGLTININKSKFMIFGNVQPDGLKENLERINIEYVTNTRYLRYNIDNNLKFSGHTDGLISKISQSIGAMNIIKNYLPRTCLLQFYHAFIGSQLFYNGLVLCRLTNFDLNRLQRAQNRAMKLVYGLERRHSTLDLFTNYATEVLPVKATAFFNLLLMVKKSLISTNGENHSDWQIIDVGRRRNQIKYPKFHKKVFCDDFICLGPAVYNQLPPEIRELNRYNVFKRELKSYLLQKKEIFLRGDQLDVNKLFG
jgi:hypothetical protein